VLAGEGRRQTQLFARRLNPGARKKRNGSLAQRAALIDADGPICMWMEMPGWFVREMMGLGDVLIMEM
jgi:hypothetical protein